MTGPYNVTVMADGWYPYNVQLSSTNILYIREIQENVLEKEIINTKRR